MQNKETRHPELVPFSCFEYIIKVIIRQFLFLVVRHGNQVSLMILYQLQLLKLPNLSLFTM